MKNSIKYLLWLFITPLFCLGVSFWNVSDLVSDIVLYSWSVSLSSSSYTNIFNYGDNGAGTYCIKISWSNWITMDMWFSNWITTAPSNLYKLYNDQYGETVCLYWNKAYFNAKLNSSSNTISYEVYKLSDLLWSYCPSDCSSVESQLTSCQSDLASCTNSCDTLVSQCQNEKSQCLFDKSDIQTSYSGCLESLWSLNEYNNSLNEQLEACLISWSTTTGDFAIYEYQLSRNDWYNDLFLPITNSIKLPYGYRGFLDDGVLAIKQLNSLDFQYSIEDSDFQENIIWSYSVVYLFLISSGLFLVFLYIIRRYFIWLKSVK